ncbi:diacylglycerol/lipid kinase family protein [Chloroflexota bacterium]
MSKYKIILNPAAGRGTVRSKVSTIEQALRDFGLEFDISYTKEPGHAIEMAKQAAQSSAEVVVAAGGDGTANEVINGLMQAKREGTEIPSMGVICIGRGNDFAFSMGIPTELDESLRVLAEDHRKNIDVGHVIGGDYPNGRYFGNCIGVGFDAEVGFVAARLRPLSGFLNYIIAAILTDFVYFKAPRVRLEYDSEVKEMTSLMVSIMNGIRLGGGFYMTPDAIIDDGLFDICLAHDPNRLRVLTLLPHFMKGTQASQPEIEIFRAAKVTLTALEGKLPAHVDGETLCVAGDRVEVDLLPGELEFICQKK